MSTVTAVDLSALKEKQQGAWASGDYATIGTKLQIVGETLCEAVDLAGGWRVLDVAAGNGNAALAAARRGCDVVATDYVPELLYRADARATAEGLRIEIQAADAESLPFPDASFDAVLSTFGVMFTPDQPKAAAELVRVCRPGGRIGLANWTPEGFVGQMFRVIGSYVAPPPGVTSPLQWGTEARLNELFAGNTVDATERHYVFREPSPEAWLDTFRNYYGPVLKAFAALDEVGQKGLASDLLSLVEQFNVAKDGTLRVPSAYLEIVVTKRA